MSYKALFAIAASLDLEIEQMDVKTAFFYGLVEEDIYLQQPTGLGDNSGHVCKLNKALYGLKQSPRVWYKTFSEFLASKGFKAIDADNSIFQCGTTYIAVYVDDLLLIGPDSIVLHEIKLELANKFSMTDLGPAAFYLGMSITRDRQNRTLRIGQQAYLFATLVSGMPSVQQHQWSPLALNQQRMVTLPNLVSRFYINRKTTLRPPLLASPRSNITSQIKSSSFSF
jgi:hypothetical protein